MGLLERRKGKTLRERKRERERERERERKREENGEDMAKGAEGQEEARSAGGERRRRWKKVEGLRTRNS